MSPYAVFEVLVIALAVTLSAWTVLGRVAPGVRRALQGKLRRGPAVGPRPSSCDSGCPRCGGCGAETAAPREQVIRFQRSRL